MRDAVVWYGVVSIKTQSVIEFFASRAQAEAMLREVRNDEPHLAAALTLLEVDFALEGAEGAGCISPN